MEKQDDCGVSVLICVLLILMGLWVFGMFGCTNSGSTGNTTLGNGQVDAVEAATLRVAVGLAFTARPDTVAPAYAVASALLIVLDGDTESTALDTIDQALSKEIAKLNLETATAASFADLVNLVKTKIEDKLQGSGVSASGKRVVVRDVIKIVQETAALRMGITVP